MRLSFLNTLTTCVFCLATFGASPVHAALITYDLQGTITEAGNYDGGTYTSPFGMTLGQGFVAKFVVDTSSNYFSDQSPDYILYSGAAYARPSAVGGQLTINGITTSLSGQFVSNAFHQSATLGLYVFDSGGPELSATFNDYGTASIPAFDSAPFTVTDFSAYGRHIIEFNEFPNFTIGTVDKLTVSIASPVPEPSTWAMMLLGFSSLGLIAYRRKKNLTGRAAA